ncbi:Hypothetical protein A7982_01507 [Minicystis rosea]|nr:Hypothetical protein A7982_01507 [Minicystis rosea]
MARGDDATSGGIPGPRRDRDGNARGEHGPRKPSSCAFHRRAHASTPAASKRADPVCVKPSHPSSASRGREDRAAGRLRVQHEGSEHHAWAAAARSAREDSGGAARFVNRRSAPKASRRCEALIGSAQRHLAAQREETTFSVRRAVIPRPVSP